jgi:hypothetical protein
MVTIRLTTAAFFTPRVIRKWNVHTPTVDRAAAKRVSPSPSAGTAAPIVAMINTQ